MAGMDGMAASPLEDRAKRTYRDITTYRSQFPDLVEGDGGPEHIALEVAMRTTRSVVGYLLMELRRANETIDSLTLDRFIDRHVAQNGLSDITANSFRG